MYTDLAGQSSETAEREKTMPKECDFCHQPLDNGWVDGRTRYGPWANMCPACHKTRGVGLGIGKGQRYDADGVQIAGGTMTGRKVVG